MIQAVPVHKTCVPVNYLTAMKVMVICDPALYLERYKKVDSKDSTHIQNKSFACSLEVKYTKKNNS